MKRLVLLGAGSYGRMLGEIATLTSKYDKIVFLDDEKKLNDISGKLCEFYAYVNKNTEFIPAIGINTQRLNWIYTLLKEGVDLATLIHTSAYVSPTAMIDSGVVILPNAVINTKCHIQTGCIINCGAIIDHDCVLEKGVHVCLGGIVKADNHIPERMKIEAGEVIENRKFL